MPYYQCSDYRCDYLLHYANIDKLQTRTHTFFASITSLIHHLQPLIFNFKCKIYVFWGTYTAFFLHFPAFLCQFGVIIQGYFARIWKPKWKPIKNISFWGTS